MKKSIQIAINDEVIEAQNECYEELKGFVNDLGRLDYCSAHVYETANYYVLQSYNTIVACINKIDDTCYDFLRLVYGYTATSAKHISKFKHQYGQGKWTTKNCLTYREI